MLEYLIKHYQRFLSKLIYKGKSHGVLGLTSLLCSKTSKVLKKLQVYQFWELKLTNTLVSSATFCVPGQ